jgi:hypothetical protein
MPVPARGRRLKLLHRAGMRIGAGVSASRRTGGMRERWGTAAQCDTFQLVLLYLEVTQ